MFLVMVNVLYDAMEDGKSKLIQSDIIEKLIGYALSHFTNEERILKNSKYPFINEHKQEHEAFVDKIGQFKKDFNAKNMALSIEMIEFMSRWWINHIKVSDRKYMPYLKDEELVH